MSFPEYSWEIRLILVLCKFLAGAPGQEDSAESRLDRRNLGVSEDLECPCEVCESPTEGGIGLNDLYSYLVLDLVYSSLLILFPLLTNIK